MSAREKAAQAPQANPQVQHLLRAAGQACSLPLGTVLGRRALQVGHWFMSVPTTAATATQPPAVPAAAFAGCYCRAPPRLAAALPLLRSVQCAACQVGLGCVCSGPGCLHSAPTWCCQQLRSPQRCAQAATAFNSASAAACQSLAASRGLSRLQPCQQAAAAAPARQAGWQACTAGGTEASATAAGTTSTAASSQAAGHSSTTAGTTAPCPSFCGKRMP